MLFLLKRRLPSACLGLVALALLGLAVRSFLHDVPALSFSAATIGLGIVVFLGLIVSDGTVHAVLGLIFRRAYRDEQLALAAVFQGQRMSAILAGSLMAGLGEELVFRGISTSLPVLAGLAVLFGLLHHIRLSLWPFTVWAIWQGWLLALAVHLTGLLVVTMTAHFLHDFAGLMIFRWQNRHLGERGV